MISILPPPKVNMFSDDEVAQLEARLQEMRAKKAIWKTVEEWWIATEVKRVTEEKVVVEVRQVEEERRRVELEE